jgi:hypothetical protein
MLPPKQSVRQLVGNTRQRAVRFPVADEVQIELSGDSIVTLSGFLRDVSHTTLRLVLPQPVRPGSGVRISGGKGVEMTGEVRYCRPRGAIYYAGVAISTMQIA